MNKGISPLINIIIWSLASIVLLLWGFLTPVMDDTAEIEKKLAGEKTVTLTVIYKNVSYEYKNLTTSAENLYDLLVEYNEVTNMEFVSTADGKIYSMFDTVIGDGAYAVRIGDEYAKDKLLEPQKYAITSGDQIFIEYVQSVDINENKANLLDGGRKNNSRSSLILVGSICLGLVVILIIRFILKKRKNS